MIKFTTTEIAPSPFLAPFIRCYTYREFNTHGVDFIKPWHAEHTISMPFFFKAVPVELVDPSNGKTLKTGKPSGIVGLSATYNGMMTFNGDYSFFEILFKPHGFRKLFNIPAGETVNQILHGYEIFGREHKLFLERLSYANGLEKMAALADDYLLQQIRKQRRFEYKDRITAITNVIVKKGGQVTLDELASHANMSVRNFERHFTNEVGVSPKHLCCVARFNQALWLKLSNPCLSWTSVAYQFSYFDQMHFIKDFKRFCGEAPASLLKHVPLLTEHTFNSQVKD